jgi:YgiT-type zinc finger domain-containing protein
MEPSAISHHVTRKGYHLIFDAVPALVCTQCGEALLDGDTIDAIQEALRALDTAAAKLQATKPLLEEA